MAQTAHWSDAFRSGLHLLTMCTLSMLTLIIHYAAMCKQLQSKKAASLMLGACVGGLGQRQGARSHAECPEPG